MKTSYALVLFLWVAVRAVFAEPPAGYRLVWADEFNGRQLDTNKWAHRDLGPRRDAINVTDSVSVSNGCLTLTSYTEEGKHYTGMVSTVGKFEAVHGYWEARVKFEDAPGEWSAFWLMPLTMGKPLGDPGTAGVEIDICEHRVTDGKSADLAQKVQHTLHWDGYGEHHQSRGHLTPPLHLDKGFHLYGCEVSAAGYKFFVDGALTWTTNAAASNAREYAILSSEIKDHGWAGQIPAGGYGNRAASRVHLIVDFVRYYSHPD